MGARRWSASVAIALACVSLGACFSFGDLSGGDTSDDGGASEASTEASTNDVDSAPRDGSVDTGPARYCSTVSPPDGAADFFCADFDGVSVGEGFRDASTGVTDGATLAATSLVAVSDPNALLTSVGPSSGYPQTAYLEMQKSGPTQLKKIIVTASINPEALTIMLQQYGGTYLIVLRNAQNSIYFEFSNGEPTEDADTYVGYVVTVEHVQGDIVTLDTFQAPSLPADLWTEVTLGYDLVTGNVTLAYDGTVVASAMEQPTTDTLIDVLIGAQNEGSSAGGNWRFDNVRIADERAP